MPTPECKDPCTAEWGTMCTEPAGHTGWHRNHRTNARWAESGRPTQSPADAPRTLPRDETPAGLYAGALRHLAGRTAVLLSTAALRLARWATTDTRETARNRAVETHHPSTRPRLSVVPTGIAQGRADLQFTYHGAPPEPATARIDWADPAFDQHTIRGGIRYPGTHSALACLGVDCPTHREDPR